MVIVPLYDSVTIVARSMYLSFFQIKRIENEAEDLKAKFSSHLDEQTADVNKFSDSVATEITVFTDLMMAAEFLVNKAHDMEVLRRYGGLKSQLEEKVVDERFESFFGIKRVYLRKGR